MKTMLAFTSLALVGIMAVVSPVRAQQTKDIVDTAVAAGSFTTLAKVDERDLLLQAKRANLGANPVVVQSVLQCLRQHRLPRF